MHSKVTSLAVLLLLPLFAGAQQRAAYTWVDDDGVRHYGDRIPAEYADKHKSVVNEHGVIVGHIEGKKSAEELAADKVAAELEMQKELQKRADRALLSTYQNVGEIEMSGYPLIVCCYFLRFAVGMFNQHHLATGLA